ncbi:glutathione import ATP-binding protein GsiA [Peptococcaceae bacterium CEB3]|nr:glutathione import ATP-binding protein GsiA [Peptococcaceae bacterium CEB3]
MGQSQSEKAPLLEVRNLKQYFPVKGGVLGRTVNHIKVVDGVSFEVFKGETLSIVGESGCGKSTTGRAILRLEEPTSGEVLFQGKNLLDLNRKDLRKTRKDIQIVFQDPFASLNPRQTVGRLLEEALEISQAVPEEKRHPRIIQLLEDVGLRADQMKRFPHEFSGGQRQRIGIARALAVDPKVVICDEAVSALDVSVQAQILNLLKKLQGQYGLTYLFISHDLGVVYHISDRVMVMYLGKIAEIGNRASVFSRPRHPYTQALLTAIPVPGKAKAERVILQGDVPSPLDPPTGCRFHTRCPLTKERCRLEEPSLQSVGPGHFAGCHLL